MKTPRKTYRQFTVAPGSAQVVAICGKGERLREHFAILNGEKITILLTEDLDLNADKIAFADEVLILNESAVLTDFETEIAHAAAQLCKPILTLTEVNQEESEEKFDDEKLPENESAESSHF